MIDWMKYDPELNKPIGRGWYFAVVLLGAVTWFAIWYNWQ